MSDRPRRLNNLDCAIAFDYGRLLEETRSKKAGYDELLIALDRAFAHSGVDAMTRELLQRCAAAVGLVDRPRFSDGATVLEWIRAVVEEAGAEMLVLPNGDLRFRPQPDPMQQIRYVIGEIGGEFNRLALRNFAEGVARVAQMPAVSEEEFARFRRLGAQVREREAMLRPPRAMQLRTEFAREALNAGLIGHEAIQIITDDLGPSPAAPKAPATRFHYPWLPCAACGSEFMIEVDSVFRCADCGDAPPTEPRLSDPQPPSNDPPPHV